MANVNFLYDEIVHALENALDLHKFRHRSFSANAPDVAITPFKVIQGHRVWYQSKAHMRFPISD